MRAHTQNAQLVTGFLASHHPGLATHRNHDVAARQMQLFGGMASFQVKGARAEAFDLVARVRVFTRATSLGGVESLIEHRASVEGVNPKSPENLLAGVGNRHGHSLPQRRAVML